MKLFHQTGHRLNWNIDSLIEDNAGDGLIFSPVNIESEKIISTSDEIKKISIFDPQLYLPHDRKGKLSTYSYFPTNIIKNFVTTDFETIKDTIAQECVELQINNGFNYIVIPCRYFETEPSNYYEQFQEHFITPFLKTISAIRTNNKILLSIIVNEAQLKDKVRRSLLLNWVTGVSGIDGVYLIFDFRSSSKQIKDAELLSEALYVIDVLALNDLMVVIGYSNTESYLYSLVFPTAITFGSYENLRRFNITRFRTDVEGVQQGPSARLYSSKLLQWIEYPYISALELLHNDTDYIHKYASCFTISPTLNCF